MFALLVVLALAGCGSSDSKVVGEWVGTFVQDDGKKLPGANLTVDKDHHWRELYGNREFSGTWRLSDKTLTLSMEKFGQLTVAEAKAKMLAVIAKNPKLAANKAVVENMDKPVPLILSEDGKTLSKRDEPLHATAVFAKQ
ncbi:MAG: hypothetical protein ACHQ50_11780 [Fimbriimonadales bacterium]